MKRENAVPPIIVKFTHRCVRDARSSSLQSKVDVTEFDNRKHWLMGSQGDNKIFSQEILTPASKEAILQT